MKEKINPRVDIAFKKIFGVEENKDLLISLINSVVSEEDQVCEVTLLNPYNAKNFKKDKQSILDIKAKGETGKRFNIEMQITDEGNYDKRALYYWAKLYTEQLEARGLYESLDKTIGIRILNFTSITQTDQYHNVFQLLEKDSHIHYFKNMEIHTIELHKFEIKQSKKHSEESEFDLLLSKVKTVLDMWVAFLTQNDLLKRNPLPEPLNDPNLKKALHVLDVMNFTKAEREVYEGNLNWLRIETSALTKKGEESFQKGIEQGREERQAEIDKAQKEAAKAQEEAAKAQEDAAKAQEEAAKAQEEKRCLIQGMIKEGISVELILKMTGLSMEELEDLKKANA